EPHASVCTGMRELSRSEGFRCQIRKSLSCNNPNFTIKKMVKHQQCPQDHVNADQSTTLHPLTLQATPPLSRRAKAERPTLQALGLVTGPVVSPRLVSVSQPTPHMTGR